MTTAAEQTIEADPEVPAILIAREFVSTPAQLCRAHADPDV